MKFDPAETLGEPLGSTSDPARPGRSRPLPTTDMDGGKDASNGCGLVCPGIADEHAVSADPLPDVLQWLPWPYRTGVEVATPGKQEVQCNVGLRGGGIVARPACADIMSVGWMDCTVNSTVMCHAKDDEKRWLKGWNDEVWQSR